MMPLSNESDWRRKWRDDARQWLRRLYWEVLGMLAGGMIGLTAFVVVWTVWDLADSPRAAGGRGGDPIDAWASGITTMILCAIVTLIGAVAGRSVALKKIPQDARIPTEHWPARFLVLIYGISIHLVLILSFPQFGGRYSIPPESLWALAAVLGSLIFAAAAIRWKLHAVLAYISVVAAGLLLLLVIKKSEAIPYFHGRTWPFAVAYIGLTALNVLWAVRLIIQPMGSSGKNSTR